MTPTLLKDEIKELAEKYPIPVDSKLELRLRRLDRMIRFYTVKAPDAPEKQGQMFQSFIVSLMYAITMIKLYRKLTVKLAELAKQNDTMQT